MVSVKTWGREFSSSALNLHLPRKITCIVSVFENQSWILTGGYRVCVLWDLDTAEVLHRFPVEDSVNSLLAIPNQNTAAAFTSVIADGSVRNFAHVIDCDKREVRCVVELPNSENGMHQYAIHPDGLELAATVDQSIHVFSLTTGRLLRQIPLGERRPITIAYGATAETLLVGTAGDIVEVDADSGDVQAVVRESGVGDWLSTLTLVPNQNRLLHCYRLRRITAIDLSTHRELELSKELQEIPRPNRLTCSTDGARVASLVTQPAQMQFRVPQIELDAIFVTHLPKGRAVKSRGFTRLKTLERSLQSLRRGLSCHLLHSVRPFLCARNPHAARHATAQVFLELQPQQPANKPRRSFHRVAHVAVLDPSRYVREYFAWRPFSVGDERAGLIRMRNPFDFGQCLVDRLEPQTPPAGIVMCHC